MNAGVIPPGDKVEWAVVGRDLQHDVGVGARELFQPRCDHHLCSEARHHESHSTGRPTAETDDLIKDRFDIRQRRAEVCEEFFAGVGRCHAARGSREETDTDPLLKPAHGVADGRSGHTEPLGKRRSAVGHFVFLASSSLSGTLVNRRVG
jgi:hypothetical protein